MFDDVVSKKFHPILLVAKYQATALFYHVIIFISVMSMI